MSLPQDDSNEPRPAGPVGAGDPPRPPVAKASSGAVPPTPPPAGQESEEHDGDTGQEVEADLDRLLEDTKRERDEYLELARRTKADFENFRKRMSAEVDGAFLRGKKDLASGMAKVADTLELALQAYGVDPDQQADESGEEGAGQGFLLVYRQVREALEEAGLEPFDPKGEKFDPHSQEALSTLPADGVESGTVVEVMQKGYRLGDHLVRPARVVVAE